MLNPYITDKEYTDLRSRLVKSRDAIYKAYEKSRELSRLLSQNDPIQQYDEVKTIEHKLWENYCSINTLVIRLDREYSKLNNL